MKRQIVQFKTQLAFDVIGFDFSKLSFLQSWYFTLGSIRGLGWEISTKEMHDMNERLWEIARSGDLEGLREYWEGLQALASLSG